MHVPAAVRTCVSLSCLIFLGAFLNGCQGQGSLCDEVRSLPENRSYSFLGDSLMTIYEEDLLGNDRCEDVPSRLGLLLRERIPSLAAPGAQVCGGEIETISEQYVMAKEYAAEDGETLDTVILDGGGNDFLHRGGDSYPCTELVQGDPSCETLLQECEAGEELTPKCKCCQFLDCAGSEMMSMLDEMINVDEVGKVIYVGHYRGQGLYADFQEASTRLMDRMRQGCEVYENATYLDLHDSFEGHYAEYMAWDQLHPNPDGVRVVAQELYGLLQQP